MGFLETTHLVHPSYHNQMQADPTTYTKIIILLPERFVHPTFCMLMDGVMMTSSVFMLLLLWLLIFTEEGLAG